MKKNICFTIVFFLLLTGLYASGTRANETIMAASTNIVLEFNNAAGITVSKTASEDSNVADATANVMEINGLVETNKDLASFLAMTDGGILNVDEIDYSLFQGFQNGSEYQISYAYLNRGNWDEAIQLTTTFNQLADRWSISVNATRVDVIEDQVGTFNIAIKALDLYAYERATLNVLIGLATPNNVVSYNAFEGAIGDMQDGGYGGLDNFAYHYILEAEGFHLTFVDRIVEVETPADYDGEVATTTNMPPGTKIKFSYVIKNENTAVATDIRLKDTIPEDTHFYHTEAPSVVGARAWQWLGSTTNTANAETANVVDFEITISGNEQVTASYCVTLD